MTPCRAPSGLVALLVTLIACGTPSEPSSPELPRELTPVPNPFGPGDPLWSSQPHRDRPGAIVADPDGARLFVTLSGTESEPGREVAVVDGETLAPIERIPVGPGPQALALHPAGRHLIVLHRFARYASIVDLRHLRVTGELPTPYYSEALVFSPDGERLYVANRFHDTILRFRVVADGPDLDVTPEDPTDPRAYRPGIAVPNNPGRLRITPDGARLLVTSETSLELTVVDTNRGEVVGRHFTNSPVTDALIVGDFVFVLHTGTGSGHPPTSGFDGDQDGAPGDGTANVTFQDVQNEIDVLGLDDMSLRHRYTSDTICCRDYRDVDPDRPLSGMELGPRDAWPPGREAYLPPRETWIVAGAMPERVLAIRRENGDAALAVVYGGSSTVQTFDIDPVTGALSPRETADTGLYRTGLGAREAVALDGGRRLVVVDSLGETLTALDLWSPVDAESTHVVVGDVSGGPFPATDVELGEAFNTVTAPFSVDGDLTCVHCHRDGTPIGKPVSMPLLDAPEWGVRLVMSYRGAYDTRPWFVEAAMDETNFFPVINEFARKENFCCEQSDPRVWARYPSREACLADEELEGCTHVLDCLGSPPPECATRPYGGVTATRDEHFRRAALAVFGRDESFGDGLFEERVGADGSIERRPVRLGFDGITRALGLFLLARPRRLPNPYKALRSNQAELGELLFRSTETGCSTCHPLPVTATARSTVVSQPGGPLSFPYVVTPMRDPEGRDVDRTNAAFLGTFPDARQDEGGLRVGVPSLRGLWDRSLFLHHGRARTLTEVLAPPSHPALADGARGTNEVNGQPNTHGGTSHLSPAELDALAAYLRTL